jgi:hypothetical protein
MVSPQFVLIGWLVGGYVEQLGILMGEVTTLEAQCRNLPSEVDNSGYVKFVGR